MANGKFILRDGNPVEEPNLMVWASWFETHDKERRVAFDKMGSAKVSTVFLGLDHSFGKGPPLLYETMVLGGSLNGTMDRYSDAESARQGHAAMVLRVKEAQAKEAPDGVPRRA